MAVLLLCGGLAMLPSTASAQAIPVELRQSVQGWQLWRGGEPYFIRGAGGTDSLQQLAASGANSVRTWAADDVDGLLDEAYALGLSVTVGLWLGPVDAMTELWSGTPPKNLAPTVAPLVLDGAAEANIPLLVKGEVRTRSTAMRARRASSCATPARAAGPGRRAY
ncbi:MAG: hypothetical protein ACNA8G_12705 [Gammaproteobacteria bacterium]